MPLTPPTKKEIEEIVNEQVTKALQDMQPHAQSTMSCMPQPLIRPPLFSAAAGSNFATARASVADKRQKNPRALRDIDEFPSKKKAKLQQVSYALQVGIQAAGADNIVRVGDRMGRSDDPDFIVKDLIEILLESVVVDALKRESDVVRGLVDKSDCIKLAAFRPATKTIAETYTTAGTDSTLANVLSGFAQNTPAMNREIVCIFDLRKDSEFQFIDGVLLYKSQTCDNGQGNIMKPIVDDVEVQKYECDFDDNFDEDFGSRSAVGSYTVAYNSKYGARNTSCVSKQFFAQDFTPPNWNVSVDGGVKRCFFGGSFIPLFPGEDIVFKHSIEKQDDDAVVFSNDLIISAEASKVCNMFNKECDSLVTDHLKIAVIPTAHVQFTIEETDDVPIEVSNRGCNWTIEPWLAGEYVKYISNSGERCTKNNYLGTMEALTHFSLVVSDGKRMLTDLQGVEGDLTDPIFHTYMGNQSRGDGGVEGMKLVMKDHVCGMICETLGLKGKFTTGVEERANVSKSVFKPRKTRSSSKNN